MRGRAMLEETLVIAEEKGSVLADRPPERNAKLIALQN